MDEAQQRMMAHLVGVEVEAAGRGICVRLEEEISGVVFPKAAHLRPRGSGSGAELGLSGGG
jgi:hypothetical protein